MKFSIKDFFSKYDQIRSFLRIWSYLLKKFLMENFIFWVVKWRHIKRWGHVKYVKKGKHIKKMKARKNVLFLKLNKLKLK